jgi:murein DD-endopeptidase MepM/ murein hydrolase activator NlpD
MAARHWSFYIVSNTSSKGKLVGFSRIFLVLVICFVIGGCFGLANCIRFMIAYGSAKYSVMNLEKQNYQLNQKLRFFEKLTEQKSRAMKNLIEFEDKTRLKYGVNTISEDIRKAGVGGKPNIEEEILLALEGPLLRNAGQIQQNIESLIRQVDLQDSTFGRLSYFVNRQNDRWAQRPSIWPVRGKITSEYGYRLHPILHYTIFHEGIDIANPVWTPVSATAGGIVSFVGNQNDYGLMVKINHDGGRFVTYFAHLVQSAVEEGQVVNRGELIGYVGNSGRSTGSHLHYEVREEGNAQNPLSYILPTNIVID